MAGLSSRRCGFESRWNDFGPLDKRISRVPLKYEEQEVFTIEDVDLPETAESIGNSEYDESDDFENI